MSDNKNVDNSPGGEKSEVSGTNIAAGDVSSVAGSVKTAKTQSRVSSSSERQIKFERAQKCLENAALVSKRIKEHRKATAELLGRPFEEDEVGDTASEMASTMSERTGYSAATDTSTTMSVQDALNIPGISESLANTLKQKELLMERIKQYKEISKRPMKTSAVTRKDSVIDAKVSIKKGKDVSDVSQLVNTIKDKENALSVMQVKMRGMETTILELQEKINEKDQIIEAKNMATTLMSDSLSKKEKDSVVLLEDTRQQMIKMQENFINMEAEWKDEKNRLIKQIDEKDEKIKSLEEANTILENSRFEINVEHSKLVVELDLRNKEILELQEKIDKLSFVEVPELTQKEKEDVEEEKGSIEIANMLELSKKIELLEQLNCQIRQTNKELENKLATMNPEQKTSAMSSPSKKGSPLPTRKGGRNTAAKSKSPWSHISAESAQETEKKPNENESKKLQMLVQSLNKEILEKEYAISQRDTLISELKSANELKESTINELQSLTKAQTNLVDVGICTEVAEISQPDTEVAEKLRIHRETDVEEVSGVEAKELDEKLKAAQEQIAALNHEIDAANKNMIKVKSNHKLKLKQMQKTIDNFSKVSDSNAEIVKLNEELHQLSQKVAELEEEKGNLQLHLVDYDSGRLTESDVYKKMVEMENLAEARLKAISVLEAQKFDLVQELHELQQKNADMEDKLADISQLHSEQVSTEIKSVQLEEQIDQLVASKKELELVVQNLKLDKNLLDGTIKVLEEEKEELIHKLENYIQENMELTDKLEKLSAEKVSSAESIEIVESLTTQEKLELEEYNKGMTEKKSIRSDNYATPASEERHESIEKLMEQSAELNSKIELFTLERQEVMEKMSKLGFENDSLHGRISELSNQCTTLETNIELLNNEKQELSVLNDELNRQIEGLKRERIDIMKDSVELAKPASVDDALEGAAAEGQPEDKTIGDKGNNRTKSVKQLTKEILKLKNTIKEREAEIGDCQMKILSLEEQQQKQNELMQSNTTYEAKVKSLTDENNQLKEELENVRRDKDSEQQMLQFKEAHDVLQQEMQKLHHEYSTTINARDARLNELENLLLEYEKQMFNYNNTLQQKDKEMAEYINQITKLNDVSQKLKSTIELLEEEKAKDQNAELVKSLNKQVSAYQKKLSECEDKLRNLEEERAQLLTIKGALENKNHNLDAELKKMQEAFAEKQSIIKELQAQQQKHADEMSNAMLEVKERDEEIHEVKLELRKESIENEKLRTALSEKESNKNDFEKQFEETKEKLNMLSAENQRLSEQNSKIEAKNKEIMEKLKKFAASVKKKSSMYTELEGQLNETQKQLESKSAHLEQLLIQVETLPALQEKLKHAEEEMNRLQSQKVSLEQQKSHDINHLQSELKTFEDKLAIAANEITKQNETKTLLQEELHYAREEIVNLKSQIDTLHNKLADHEIEQKNNMNFITKIASLEADINQKQIQIAELSSKLENQVQQVNQLQYGHDAKVQERDLYIESLENEISKYKNRICRLEESISIMEDRRHSLERKADQLDSQLQEKHKAYTEYSSQEDQLVGRLAVLMDHDRVVEKQLHEIDSENKELQYKISHFNEENQRLRKSLSDIQEHCNTLVEKASKADFAESEIIKLQTKVSELEAQLKRITQEHQTLMVQRKQDIDELESEFNTQIENAIKEKKTLSEKYEKINEHVIQLEHKLQEYRNNNANLNINVEELTRINQELIEKASYEEPTETPDYTEQYISEINNLNAIINSKNQQIYELNNSIHSLQKNNLAVVSNLESKIEGLNDRLQYSSAEIDKLVEESCSLRVNNDQLQSFLAQKDEEIKQLVEKKTVTFEMNIPKTEGMFISSTIEAINMTPKEFDVSSLESQIVSDTDTHMPVKVSEQTQKQSPKSVSSARIIEEVIVPKKTYLCYQGEDNVPVEAEDPFNSDEGWGFGESEETSEVTPGLSHLNDQIEQLKKENQALKTDLDASSSKLLKAMKKLKELKSRNDMLTNELKISKQITQSSFLDSAIEDEMKINIQDLEKKIEEITTELNKEKREKENIKKQNEVFINANDKLTEMKEKLDNEIELWKFKFKEANDKVSSFQWGADSKDSPEHKISRTDPIVKDSKLQDDLAKVEKENDELMSIIDQLTSQNKELTSQQAQMKAELSELNKRLKQNQSTCENYETLNDQLRQVQNNYTELLKNNEILKEELRATEIRFNEITEKYMQLQSENEENRNSFDKRNKELIEQNCKLEQEIQSLKQCEAEAKNEISSLISELGAAKSKIENVAKLEQEIESLKHLEAESKNQISSLISELEVARSKSHWHEEQLSVNKPQIVDTLALTEKLSAMEDYCSQMKHDLDSANSKVSQFETTNQKLLQSSKDLEEKVTELNAKIQHLNNDNDQLLSTVAELRSSVLKDPSLQSSQNLEETVNELNAKIQHLNTENDQLLSTVTELRSSVSSAIDQRGFEIAELWKQHLSQREADFQKTEQELRTQLSAFEAKYEQLLDTVQSSSQEETSKMIMMEQVASLQNKLHDKEDHLRNLQDKYAEVINQLDMLRSEMEDEKLIHENKILGHQEEYEKQIQELTASNQQYKEGLEQSHKSLQSELAATKTCNDELNQQIQELRNKIEEYERSVIDLTNQLRMKDSEIYQKTHDYTITLTQRNEEFENVRKQLIEFEKKVEDLSYEKESELAVLRLKMHERSERNDKLHSESEAEKLNITEALNAKIIECTNLNKQISELNKSLEEHSNRASEMQTALENQEFEIVTLKDEVANLRDMLRSSSSKIEKHVTFASDTKPARDGESSEEVLNKELMDVVPRAELDLALYMMHQRDVRCEELTMELTHLLEERDTLQLRLSDSIRSYEELKSKCQSAGLDVSLNSSREAKADASFSVVKNQQFVETHRGQTSRSSSISDPDGEKPELQAKLSELRSARHSRDVTFRQESEQRQMDLRLMLRDVANLPPEAIDQLSQAHDLSRESQSTSTVLLNWLRGKSSTKVVHM